MLLDVDLPPKADARPTLWIVVYVVPQSPPLFITA